MSDKQRPTGPGHRGWAEHAIWWHVYPLGFTGAPIRDADPAVEAGEIVHRLRALIPWLDHLVELGANGLLLGPIFASEHHGYDTVDHFRIDPRLGDDEDFDALVAACRERGIRILLDGVFNHVGAGHPALLSALEHGRDDPRAGLFSIDWSEPSDPRPSFFEGHSGLVELDHAGEAAAELVGEAMRHWLRRGADGWRLDAAYSVDPSFWARVLPGVREEFPDAWFLGEVIHGDYAAIAAAGSLDLITAYELWKAVWSSLVDRNMWELAWALERHAAFARGTRLQTFVGNHDVARIASLAGDDGAAIAAAVLLTLPGLPSIYYGDEQAFQGVKGEGAAADDPLRPELPATPADLAPEGRWLHALHRELIALRRANPWISDGELRVAGKTNGTIDYEVAGGGRTLRVRLELDPSPRVRATIDGDDAFGWGG